MYMGLSQNKKYLLGGPNVKDSCMSGPIYIGVHPFGETTM